MNQQKKKKYIILAIIAVLLCGITAIAFAMITNEYYPELNVPKDPITLEYGVDKMPK